MADQTQQVLDQRQKEHEYGAFILHGIIVQLLKGIVHGTPAIIDWKKLSLDPISFFEAIRKKWESLAPDQQEAIDMALHKLGRIMNGNADKEDSWRDFSGYPALVANRLLKEQQQQQQSK